MFTGRLHYSVSTATGKSVHVCGSEHTTGINVSSAYEVTLAASVTEYYLVYHKDCNAFYFAGIFGRQHF